MRIMGVKPYSATRPQILKDDEGCEYTEMGTFFISNMNLQPKSLIANTEIGIVSKGYLVGFADSNCKLELNDCVCYIDNEITHKVTSKELWTYGYKYTLEALQVKGVYS
jgi:hypothetical protein